MILSVDDWGNGFGERIWGWESPNTNWYYVKISQAGLWGNTAFQVRAAVERSSLGDEYEDDDTAVQANFISLADGAYQLHDFHDDGDMDWVLFYAFSDRSYEIRVFDAGINSDTVLQLYAADGETPIGDPIDDGIEGEEEILLITPGQVADGVVYVRIQNYDGSIFGDETNYKLQVQDTTGGFFGNLRGYLFDITDINIIRALSGEVQVTENKAGAIPFIIPAPKGFYSIQLPSDTGNTWDVISTVFEAAFIDEDENIGMGFDIQQGTNTLNFGFIKTNLPPPITQNISLQRGWNNISLYVHPTDMSLRSLFANLIATGKLVKVVSNGKNFDPLLPDELNTLVDLKDGRGYWFKVNSGIELEIEGTPIDHTTKSISLKPGWNHIGVLPQGNANIRTALKSLLDNNNIINILGRGIEFDPGKPDTENSLLELQPGRGYWLKVNQLQEFYYQ